MQKTNKGVFPYDPTPYVKQYDPQFERLVREAPEVLEPLRGLVPTWKPTAQQLARELGLEIRREPVAWRILYRRYGFLRSVSCHNYFLVIQGDTYYSTKISLDLLARRIRRPRDLELVVGRLDRVLSLARELQRRLEEIAGQVPEPERKIFIDP